MFIINFIQRKDSEVDVVSVPFLPCIVLVVFSCHSTCIQLKVMIF